MRFPAVLDCTIRDGGYANNWHFESKLVREVYRAASKAGVDFVEIGFRGTEEHFSKEKYGLWRFSQDEDILQTINGIQGAKIAVMGDFGKITPDDFPLAQDSPVTLVRVAANKTSLKEAILLLERIKAKGYDVSLNAMGYTNFTSGERRQLAEMLKDAGLDYVYVADSYGSLFPDQIPELFAPLLELRARNGIKVGFHPHNSLQMAFANTLEAIRAGVDIVDCTFYGMGRAAGNLPTEILISYLSQLNVHRYNAIPILNCIDLYFLSIYQEHPWGYCLPFMLSGLFKCHPNYAFEMLERRRYTIEDIWKAMEIINRLNPVGYDKKIVGQLLSKGIISDKERQSLAVPGPGEPQGAAASQKPAYLGRHQGRNFLVLANGPNLKIYRDQIQAFIERYDPIVLGANYLGGLFIPYYHAFASQKRFLKYIDQVDPHSRLLISQHIDPSTVAEYTQRPYETIYYRDGLESPFGIENGVISTDCRTISVLLLGVAVAMGADRVFAAGMDGYLELDGQKPSLFYEEKDEILSDELNTERQYWCQFHIAQIDRYIREHGGEGVHILTPTTYKGFYKGIDNYM